MIGNRTVKIHLLFTRDRRWV